VVSDTASAGPDAKPEGSTGDVDKSEEKPKKNKKGDKKIRDMSIDELLDLDSDE
jgi:hypothetical protein